MKIIFVNPDKISREKIRKSFKKAINVLRKESYIIDIKCYRKAMIDCATPRNQIHRFGTTKVIHFLQRTKKGSTL